MGSALPDYVRALPRVFLREGEMVFTSRQLVVQTVLGSCVSVIMRDAESGLSAMCHAAMPNAPQWETESLRYVDGAIDRIIRRFKSSGIDGKQLQVKLVGGADLRVDHGGKHLEAVGTRNLQTAIAQLESRGLQVTASHSGGDSGRRVLFVTSTGEVFVHTLPHSFRNGR